jgi:hypothetical protein
VFPLQKSRVRLRIRRGKITNAYYSSPINIRPSFVKLAGSWCKLYERHNSVVDTADCCTRGGSTGVVRRYVRSGDRLPSGIIVYSTSKIRLTLSLLMSYIRMYGAPCKARNFNVVYIYGHTHTHTHSHTVDPGVTTGLTYEHLGLRQKF